jgi:hypothetical protein
MGTFEDFCVSKNIDPTKFEHSDKILFSEWKSQFENMHPNSFVEQKKFLINKVRRLYLLSNKI